MAEGQDELDELATYRAPEAKPLPDRARRAEPPKPPAASVPPSDDEHTIKAPETVPPSSGPTPSGLSASAQAVAPAVGRLEPGQVIFDKYEVLKMLGQGGMGTVWLVRHRELHIERALKMIVGNIATDPEARARLKREARVLALFSHPNAVAVHDARVAADAAFIEMEYVRGECLSDLLEPGVPMPLDWTARILVQLCDVLQVAHEHGIVHRDLKPSNLMLVEGQPPGHEWLKVLDFGIAKILTVEKTEAEELHTKTGVFIGTIAYMSPDQAVSGSTDHRSDLYSVGVLLYEFLTGYRPFSGPTAIYDHINTPPPRFKSKNPRVQVPEAVEKVVLSCLAKKPEDRPESAQDLAEAFLKAAGPKISVAAESVRMRGGTRVSSGVAAERTEKVALRSKALPLTEAATAIRLGRRSSFPIAWVSAAVGAAALGLALVLAFWPGLLHRQGGSGARQGSDAREGQAVQPIESAIAGRDGTSQGQVKSSGGTLENVLGRKAEQGTGKVSTDTFYEPEVASETVEGHPRVLVRRGDRARFILIEGGSFRMGSSGPTDTDPAVADDRPAHPVRVSSFYLQENEVTIGEMRAFFRAKRLGPANWPKDFHETWSKLTEELHLQDREADRYPAVGINHLQAEEFASSVGGRLPTEAEWEFAARSRGLDQVYVWGDKPEPSERIANILNTSGSITGLKPVRAYPDDKTKQEIFDMTGNVREWCLDAWARYADSPVEKVNPRVETSPDSTFVIRGGSFLTDVVNGRTTYRSDHEHDYEAKIDLGMRVVIDVPKSKVPPPGH